MIIGKNLTSEDKGDYFYFYKRDHLWCSVFQAMQTSTHKSCHPLVEVAMEQKDHYPHNTRSLTK